MYTHIKIYIYATTRVQFCWSWLSGSKVVYITCTPGNVLPQRLEVLGSRNPLWGDCGK